MTVENLHFDMSPSWKNTSRQFIAMKATFPARMAVFYAAMAERAKKVVQDELIEKVYSQPLPQSAEWGSDPSPRTGRTLLAIKASASVMRSTVYIDRRSFPVFFYPYILEHGRLASPAYYARNFFRDAMRKMEVIYFREARIALKTFMFERGFL